MTYLVILFISISIVVLNILLLSISIRKFVPQTGDDTFNPFISSLDMKGDYSTDHIISTYLEKADKLLHAQNLRDNLLFLYKKYHIIQNDLGKLKLQMLMLISFLTVFSIFVGIFGSLVTIRSMF